MSAQTAKASVKDARRRMYRQMILEAAERVFAERGYDAARMQDVAAEAGLAIGTVYAAVHGKEDLYAAIHESRGRALLERAAAAAKAASTALEALMRGVEAYVQFLTEHPHYLMIHLKESQPWALAPRFRTEEQRQQWRRGLELSVSVFRSAIAEGSVVDEDPERLARLMIAAHQVLLVEWVEGGMKIPHEELARVMKQHLLYSFAKDARRHGGTKRGATARERKVLQH